MNKQVIACIVLSLSVALVSAARTSPIHPDFHTKTNINTQQQQQQQPEYFTPDVCPAQPAPFCNRMIQPGCACFTNGTCNYMTAGNRCSACFQDEVVSFNVGEQCPDLDGGKLYTCDGTSKPAFCPMYITQGCICYSNGTCTEGSVNQCSDCQRDGVVSVIEGASCPRIESQDSTVEHKEEEQIVENSSERFFTPDVCPAQSRPFCNRMVQPGCACFANGTCEYITGSNRCSSCFQDDVVSFNVEQQCPELGSRGKLYTCNAASKPAFCPMYITQGCICYDDGSCVEGSVNQCSECQRDGVVSVVEGASCPRISDTTTAATADDTSARTVRRHTVTYSLRGRQNC